ncbi:MAG: RNA polymerase sigma factor [Burkholderiales bacterium]|nr:MAG: RNA polymerase sigma factor [Burkholderiales bacterium]
MIPSMDDIIEHLKRVLARRGFAAGDSDDFIQEAMVRLEVYQKTNEVQHVKGFLARTVVNIAIDTHRKRKSVEFSPEPVELHGIVDAHPQPEEVYASRQRLLHLSRGLASLDPVTRQIVSDQRLDGLSIKEISAKRGLSVSSVEKRLAKGLAYLMDWMSGW